MDIVALTEAMISCKTLDYVMCKIAYGSFDISRLFFFYRLH